MVSQSDSDLEKTVGLCATCKYAQRVKSDRGPTYYLCRLAAVDDRFVKYPNLPVLECEGYEEDEGKAS